MNKGHFGLLLRAPVTLVLLSVLSACVFVPDTSVQQDYAEDCHMLTRKLTLRAEQIRGQVCADGETAEACLMTYGAILPTGTLIISGSIVVVGNSLHWLEYHGACPNGTLRKAMS